MLRTAVVELLRVTVERGLESERVLPPGAERDVSYVQLHHRMRVVCRVERVVVVVAIVR